MTPHVPTLFALAQGIRPSSDTGSTAEHRSSTSTDPVEPMVDKKRARPPEEATRARKKVASELMAFEFESLSLSAPNVAPALTDRVPSRRPVPEQSAVAQHQGVHRQQEQYQEQQQEHTRQYQQHHHQAHQQQPERARAIEQQRTGDSHRAQGHGARPRSFTTSSPASSAASSSSSSTPRPGRLGHTGSTHIYTHEDRRELMASASTQSSYSAFSPPSPPISPLPSARPMNMDVSMSMDEGIVDASLSNPGKEAPRSAGIAEVHTSNVRTLNLRQRKWNSVRKEWQEWHDVQATHASDTPLTTRVSDTSTANTAGALGNAGPEIGTDALFHATNMIQNGFEGLDSNGQDAAIHGSPSHSQSSGLGRQRSLNEARGKSKDEHSRENTQEEQRIYIGARARSFSETHIYPLTQPLNHPQQLDPYTLPTSEQVNPSSERIHYFSSQATQQLPPQTSLHQHAHSPQLAHRHPGHPPRHHSDNIYSPHGDMWDGNDDGETGRSMRRGQQPHAQLQQPRPEQLMLGSGVPQHHQQQHPWNALSMTALDGTMNIPGGDRFSRPALGSSPTDSTAIAVAPSTMAHVSPTSPLSPPNSRHEDVAPWNQQLLKSQKEYKETTGGARLGFGPANPIPYGQHQHAHMNQQHNQEDVYMGEEAVRQLPSRSSSPSPCLSMAPTITRPLSISFSQLAGSNMLGHLAEHEHDDDMEL
ncbi:hypothetical protein BGZ72_006889 [Mortierella alpina]|nr:hypothetical protein BGZ72_006889 [Mortierella alpina]